MQYEHDANALGSTVGVGLSVPLFLGNRYPGEIDIAGVGGVISATLFMLLLPLALRRLKQDDEAETPAQTTTSAGTAEPA